MTKPYTYLLHHVPTNTFYYGVRWAKNCHPDEFWKTYFTSSKKLVPELRKKYGDDSFEFEIRKTFEDKKKAQEWEHKVLRRMKVLKKHNIWLNRTDNKAIIHEATKELIDKRTSHMKNHEYAVEHGKKSHYSALVRGTYVPPPKATTESALKAIETKKRNGTSGIGVNIGVKGKKPWCAGKTGMFSKETIEKMKQAKIGKKLPNRSGVNHWTYRRKYKE